jgi:hypothetical protein
MSTENSPASPASPKTQPAQLSGGLHLTGTVIAVRTEEKEWEKEKYTQTTVSISDGEQVYLMRHRHDSKPWNVLSLAWAAFCISIRSERRYKAWASATASISEPRRKSLGTQTRTSRQRLTRTLRRYSYIVR